MIRPLVSRVRVKEQRAPFASAIACGDEWLPEARAWQAGSLLQRSSGQRRILTQNAAEFHGPDRGEDAAPTSAGERSWERRPAAKNQNFHHRDIETQRHRGTEKRRAFLCASVSLCEQRIRGGPMPAFAIHRS